MNDFQAIRNIKKEDYPTQGSWEERVKFFLQFGILAPSTHNSQPWLFRVKNNTCEVHYDVGRLLPAADPKLRDLHISLGCCIENIIIAAKVFNVSTDIQYFDSTENTLRSVITFNIDTDAEDIETEQSLSTIQSRLNARGLFNGHVPPQDNVNVETMSTENIEVKTVYDSKNTKILANLSLQGIGLAYDDEKFKNEIGQWVRNNFSKSRDGMIGYSLRMSTPLSMLFPFIVKKFNVKEKILSINKEQWKNVPAVCLLGSDENFISWMQLGRVAEKSLLALEARNIQCSISQAAIEFLELQVKIQNLLNMKYLPQFLFRFGSMPDKQKVFSRRLTVDSRLI